MKNKNLNLRCSRNQRDVKSWKDCAHPSIAEDHAADHESVCVRVWETEGERGRGREGYTALSCTDAYY